ncbi:MAG: hypothetical protein V4787_04530 [Pseudomonadota bacterium]
MFRLPAAPLFFSVALMTALAGFGVLFDRLATSSTQAEASPAQHAALERDRASPEVLQVAKWAVNSNDHAGLPFFVVDKTKARLFAFDEAGRLRASTSVLLGSRRGDGAAVPETPAGRFVSDTWRTALDDGIVWIDGRAALSLHRASSSAAPGRAAQRLASQTVDDKRISDGSLHVADEFYGRYVAPLRAGGSIAYVLPEVLPMGQLFALTDDLPEAPIAHRRPS